MIPQELLVRRSPGYLPAVEQLDAVFDPGGLAPCSSVSHSPRGLRHIGKGSARSQTEVVLGAMCQIQGYTLHLAALVYLPFRLAPSVIKLLGG